MARIGREEYKVLPPKGNTKKANQHHHRTVGSLGYMQEDPQIIGRVIEDYFTQMFTSATLNRTKTTIEAMDQVVTPLHNQILLSSFTAEEIKKVVFQMHHSKAPGPDGMSCFFFQKYWHILGDNVTQVVLSFLNSGHLLKKINYAHIVLILKIKNPQRVSDYRPISLCNVLYRIVSKVLANRL